MQLTEVQIAALAPDRFQAVLPAERYTQFVRAIEEAQDVFSGRIVWNVNSTAHGGGVAEMLRSLLAYARGAGVDTRWMVIEGTPEFFAITKRLHNRLHGFSGDGGSLGAAELEIYRNICQRNAEDLIRLIQPPDIVLLHDPQTAGMCESVKEIGATVIWRCHVGIDRPDHLARTAWEFLRQEVLSADAYIFSRPSFAWDDLDPERVNVIPPSIDAFSPKNQELEPSQVAGILAAAGLIDSTNVGLPTFARVDGSLGTVVRTAKVHGRGVLPPSDAPLVAQVSRWDRLKDPIGVVRGFAEHVARRSDAHLIVAGPSVEAVADDPEGAQVLRECERLVGGLRRQQQDRIHLASLPMEDGEENAAIVNALQRRANVVVQKSLAEGFGLTVAEAMWKARPVVASRIGGIQDQVIHGETGILLDEPRNLERYGAALVEVLSDLDRAQAMGAKARERVRDAYLGPRHLIQYLILISNLLRAR